MQTPGMLIMSNMAPGTIDRLVSYAQMAEARGLRNFLVTASLTDSLIDGDYDKGVRAVLEAFGG